MPRACAREMLDQFSREDNPLQRSSRITEKLIQLYADGMTRQEISSLSLLRSAADISSATHARSAHQSAGAHHAHRRSA
jgi:hypothetical protein